MNERSIIQKTNETIPSSPFSLLFPSTSPISTSPIVDADVIIRSSNDVDFRVVKVDLIRASQTFADIFAIPQGSSCEADTENGIPVVRLTETGVVLDPLLKLCIPDTFPAITDLCQAEELLKVVKKYDFRKKHMEYIEKEFVRLAAKDPVRAYAITHSSHLETPARQAARLCLFLTLDEMLYCNFPEREILTMGDFQRLLEYRKECQVACLDIIKSPSSWINRDHGSLLYYMRSLNNSHAYGKACNRKCGQLYGGLEVEGWWVSFMIGLATAFQSKIDFDQLSFLTVLRAFMVRGNACGSCQEKMIDPLNEFVSELKAKLEETIASVQLKGTI